MNAVSSLDIFSSLNEEQVAAVSHIYQGLLVMAPVGTGKTTVLTRRAANAIRSGLNPKRMLCLSFTNKAAREMQDRIRNYLGQDASGIHTCTFHALCAHILRSESDALGISYDFAIYDEEDCKEILRVICKELGLEPVSRPRAESDREVKLEDVYNWIQARKLSSCLEQRVRDSIGRTIRPRTPSEPSKGKQILALYNRRLADNHAFDFADLIALVCRAFVEEPDLLSRWQEKYEWIQVDEVQDTSIEEYYVIYQLALKTRNLAFFGDLDQTIYEWRGSDPTPILRHFKETFAPVKELVLTKNYRSTRNILQACEGVIRRYSRRITGHIDCYTAVEGEKIYVHAANNGHDEGIWIGQKIKEIKAANNLSFRDFVVLARTNSVCEQVSEVLQNMDIPNFLVDQYKFFRRTEIKDALAYLRLIVHPHDGNSAWRIVHMDSSPYRIPEKAQLIMRQSRAETGFRVTDLFLSHTFQYGDPFGLLLDRLNSGRAVVFDVETTGLDIKEDDIVELGAVRMGAKQSVQELHRYVRPTRPVGESFKTHGLSDHFLQENGEEPKNALQTFLKFAQNCILIGHNVSFDTAVLAYNLERNNLSGAFEFEVYDTFDMARRFLDLPNYRLDTIQHSLGLPTRPTHRALDDARCTGELLLHLLPIIKAGRAKRQEIVSLASKQIQPLAEKIARWRRLADSLRPPQLLSLVLKEARLKEFWKKKGEFKRLEHLNELEELFAVLDDPDLAPMQSLRNILSWAALSNDADRYLVGNEKVAILTVHQAKGLEFDTVFICGASEDIFPSWQSTRQGNIEEEHRLFYVAMTRARKRLLISFPLYKKDRYGRLHNLEPSRFVRMIPAEVISKV